MSNQPHWGYDGDEGPDHWAELSETFYMCAEGHQQSPIDIHPGDVAEVHPHTFTLNYQPTTLRLINNEHSIQVNCDPGSTITYGETTYGLVQFHFHHPSEHTIDGKLFEMELHLVHADDEGHFLVVGVMLEPGEVDHPAYQTCFKHMPKQLNKLVEVPGVQVDPAALLPADHHVYMYDGSLTTPPCSQGVRWLVMRAPVQLGPAQIAAFTALYPNNARPVQPMYERKLYEEDE